MHFDWERFQDYSVRNALTLTLTLTLTLPVTLTATLTLNPNHNPNPNRNRIKNALVYISFCVARFIDE